MGTADVPIRGNRFLYAVLTKKLDNLSRDLGIVVDVVAKELLLYRLALCIDDYAGYQLCRCRIVRTVESDSAEWVILRGSPVRLRYSSMAAFQAAKSMSLIES